MIIRQKRTLERGATAIIIVMFSVLLFITITMAFMKLMSDEQVRANDNELSQGAYDSALAGVEDGKRVLSACLLNPTGPACAAIDSQECTTVGAAGIAAAQSNGEVYLKTNTGTTGTDFAQAYTCVKINRNTPDYKESISADGSIIVPLTAAPGQSFDSIVLSWFTPDPTNPTSAPNLDSSTSLLLPRFADWGGAAGQRPPLMRLQLMQFNRNSFLPADFDNSNGASTVYLYPKSVGTTTTGFATDGRRTGSLEPTPVRCSTNYSTYGGYACRVEVTLPAPAGGAAADRVAYLRLTSLYNATKVRVEMKRGTGETVDFFNVQPSIDSTGRAADVFRRVESRVEMVDPSVPFPRATVDITNNFCKAFMVTIDPAQYDPGPCVP